MQDECLDVSNKPFYKRRKTTSKGRFIWNLKNYADAHMALILWWRCNYIDYGINHRNGRDGVYVHVSLMMHIPSFLLAPHVQRGGCV